MRNSLAAVLVLPSLVFAWETSDCKDTKTERLDALPELREIALEYQRKYGSIPNLHNASASDVFPRLPGKLKNYSIYMSAFHDNSIGYSCYLNPNQIFGDESCFIDMNSSEIDCLEFELIDIEPGEA